MILQGTEPEVKEGGLQGSPGLGVPGEVRCLIGLKIPLLIDTFYLGQSSIPEPNMFQFQR